MPIGQWLLPGKEYRHPRARSLASAAVQVRIKLVAHYVELAHRLGKLFVPCESFVRQAKPSAVVISALSPQERGADRPRHLRRVP
jgi:hypothetical protein